LPIVLSDSRWPYTVIPAEAGIQSFQSRGTRDWTPAFAGVTGREKVIILAIAIIEPLLVSSCLWCKNIVHLVEYVDEKIKSGDHSRCRSKGASSGGFCLVVLRGNGGRVSTNRNLTISGFAGSDLDTVETHLGLPLLIIGTILIVNG
jgi:hypothetical protein